MKKQNHWPRLQFLFVFLAFVLPTISSAGPRVQGCQKKPLFSHQSKASLVKNIESLPNLIFAASIANYYVENKEQTFKIWAQHSFELVKSSIVCADIPEGEKPSLDEFSFYAPTLMDLTRNQKVGSSFWQFHLSAEGSKLGIWNQPTRFAKLKEFEKKMSEEGVQVQVFQTAYDKFELILKREKNSFSETLSIRFDTAAEVR